MHIKFYPQRMMAPTFLENEEDLKGVTAKPEENKELLNILEKELAWLSSFQSNLIAHPIKLDNEEAGEREKAAARNIEADVEAMAIKLTGLRAELVEKASAAHPEESEAKRAQNHLDAIKLEHANFSKALEQANTDLGEAIAKKREVKARYDAACVAAGKKLIERFKDYGAKVEGKEGRAKTPHEIGEARLSGKEIYWTKKGFRDVEKTSKRKEIDPVVTEFIQKRGEAQNCRKKIAELQASIEQKEADIKNAQVALENSHQRLEESKGKTRSDEEIKVVQEELLACEQEVHLALGQLGRIKGIVDKFQQEANALKSALSLTQSELHEALSGWQITPEETKS